MSYRVLHISRRRAIGVTLLPSVALILGACSFGDEARFSGDDSAALGARVYVDGRLIGQLPERFDSTKTGWQEVTLERAVAGGHHSVIFVSRSGDSLRGDFVNDGSTSVTASFSEHKILGTVGNP